MAELKTSIIIQAQDRFSVVAKKIEAAGGKLSKGLTEAQKDLASLGKKAADVKRFGILKKSLADTGQQMRTAQVRAQALGRKIAQMAAPTKKIRNEFERARRETRRLGQRHREQTSELQRLRGDLRGAGIDTRKLSDAQRRLSQDIAATTQKMGRLGNAAEAAASRVSAAQGRVAEAQARLDKRVQTAANLSLASGAVDRTGQRLLDFAEAPTRAAMEFESVMADVKKVVDFESPQQFRSMGRDILGLSKRIPMAAAGLGEIVAAAGQASIARGELVRFTEDAATMGVAFDLSGAEAGSAMTGLRSIFLLNQDQVVSLGDSYNHLSNNMDATAAQMLNIASRAGAQARLFGLNAQQLGALAASFLALKTPPEVAGTAINALLLRLKTADKQGKKFSRALGSIGLSAQGLKKSIESDAQGALLGFLEAVQQSKDVTGTLSDLFGAEYADDVAKIVGSLDIYRKAVGLAADQGAAAGSMQAEFEARAATAANAVILMENSAQAAQIALGEKLLPDVTRMAGAAAATADATGRLIEEFPGLGRAVAGGAAVLGGLAKVVAPVLEAASALLMAAAWMQLRAAKAQLAAAGRGVAGDIAPTGGGRARNAGRKVAEGAKGLGSKVRGFGGRAVNMLKGRLGIVGAGLAALSIGSTLLDSDKTAGEKTRGVSRDVGALGGALAGAKLGALLGSVVPGAGTAVGAGVGSILGGVGGAVLGGKAGDTAAGLIDSDAPTGLVPALAAPGGPGEPGSGVTNIDNSSRVEQLIINQQPGEDAGALADRVLREIEQRRRVSSREALLDE